MAHVPYGYKIVNAQAVIDEPAAEKLGQLFREYVELGSMRAAAIKVRLKKTHSVIGRLLKNRVYMGTEYYPRIIEDELFQKTQELRDGNAKNQNRIRAYKEPAKIELKDYKLGKAEEKFSDPYKQAEYVYGLIEEDSDE